MIPLTTLYNQQRLTKQKKPFQYIVPAPQEGRNNKTTADWNCPKYQNNMYLQFKSDSHYICVNLEHLLYAFIGKPVPQKSIKKKTDLSEKMTEIVSYVFVIHIIYQFSKVLIFDSRTKVTGYRQKIPLKLKTSFASSRYCSCFFSGYCAEQKLFSSILFHSAKNNVPTLFFELAQIKAVLCRTFEDQ